MRGKGMTRLAIVLGVPYFGWWAFMFASNFRNQQFAAESYRRGVASGDSQATRLALQWQSLTARNIEVAVIWGLVVPLAILIVWLVGRWVYRGFRAGPN